MKTNELFIKKLSYMNTTMKGDNSIGNQWKYCNKTGKKANGFEQARKQGKFLLNCVDGVQWALKLAGVPASALHWYGTTGKIAWTTSTGKASAKKYFKIISTGGKTVKQLYNQGLLCDGDILLGFQAFSHTCCYYGGKKSFDSGHAYCSGSGEGAKFKKWIGSMTCKNSKVNYILRLKDRAQYRVQAGAFHDLDTCNKKMAQLAKKGIKTIRFTEDGMYKLQAGLFSGKTNAERKVAALAKKGVPSFIKEI